MQLRFNQKQQLVTALEARRSWAKEHDKRTAAKHRRDEDKVLKEFRDACRDYGRMNLVDLKTTIESKDRYDRKLTADLPSCPMSAITMLDETLAGLRLTHQETFTLNGDYKDVVRHAHWLLTHNDNPAPATVCA